MADAYSSNVVACVRFGSSGAVSTHGDKTGLFDWTGAGNAAQVAEGDAYAGGNRLEQGFTEAANVEVVPEMVNMIEVQRQFEAYQKVMQTSDTLDRAATDKVGRRQG